jgi:site-specific recombinase XerD
VSAPAQNDRPCRRKGSGLDLGTSAPGPRSWWTRWPVTWLKPGTFLAPASVDSVSIGRRQLCRWLLAETEIRTVASINRNAEEDYKVWLADQPGMGGRHLSANTQRQRLRVLRVFFERIIEWEWTDAPTRNPIIGRDIPPRPEPFPKFLDSANEGDSLAAISGAGRHGGSQLTGRSGI